MRAVSAKKKAELVQKLLKGADIRLVSRIEGIPVGELKKWCALVKLKLRSRMDRKG
jgi:DNA-directed RNA polymerase specialized sigma24 family protein